MVSKEPVTGGEPSTESLEWLKYCRELLQKSAADLDDKAKTYITVGSSLATTYTGAIGFLKIIDKEIAPLWLSAIPVVMWMLAIIFLARVLWPGIHLIDPDSVTDSQILSEKLPQEKYNRLKLGGILSLSSIGLMLFVLLLGSWLGSLITPPKNVQLAVLQDKQALFASLPISF